MSSPGAPTPTSLRIAPADRRRIAAAARRRGQSTQKFIIAAALREASQTRAAESGALVTTAKAGGRPSNDPLLFAALRVLRDLQSS